jgi:site-specific DNA-methyltransferase (adenine-specific)
MKVTDKITITNEDNMLLMARYPDNYFDLAIVDPPYGLGKRIVNGGSVSNLIKNQNKKVKNWDDSIPSEKYFKELFRVSKNQIIWGGNYFPLPPSRCFIVWDKTIHGNSYADADFAWSSFDSPARIYKENISITTSEGRIHPTQKSIKLYKWLLYKYAKENDKILDTHLGSGSIAIACHDYGFELTACELDKEYYNKAIQRIINHTNQTKLF